MLTQSGEIAGYAPRAEATRLKLRHLKAASNVHGYKRLDLEARFSGCNFSQNALSAAAASGGITDKIIIGQALKCPAAKREVR